MDAHTVLPSCGRPSYDGFIQEGWSLLRVRKQRSLGWAVACAGALMCAMPASAQQVFKCVNEYGRLVYSDSPCPEKARSAQVISVKPNTLDMTEAREQEFRAQIRREEELARQAYENELRRQAWEMEDAQRRAREEQKQRQATMRKALTPPDPREQRRMNRPPAAIPMHPEPPALITNCDPGGCWDTQGRRFNSAGGGNFHRSDGKFCVGAGPNVICH